MPFRIAIVALALALSARPASAQTATPERPVRIGGYVQPQYEQLERPEERHDRVFFRRAVVTVDGQPAPDWFAAFIIDFGPAAGGGRLIVKDAYVQYRGWHERGVTLAVGNQKTPFSRSTIASSSKRGLIERPFTGDKGYGAAGRTISVRADGWTGGHAIRWFAATGSALHAPASDQIRLDGLPEASDDWNEGVMFSGRMEWHPFGETPLEQSSFDRGPLRLAVGGAAYGWRNDGDRNPNTHHGRSLTSALVDADAVAALEVSSALRGHGLSFDAALTRVGSRALDAACAGGLYEHGEAHLQAVSVEGGYMIARRLEALGSFDALDSRTFAALWRRTAGGLNVYFARHDVKLSTMYRVSMADHGVAGARVHATYVQAQFAF